MVALYLMLEQGEQVFHPSDPMAGMALAMNSMFPRFQNGGYVGAYQSSGGSDNLTEAGKKKQEAVTGVVSPSPSPGGDPIPQSDASGAREAPPPSQPYRSAYKPEGLTDAGKKKKAEVSGKVGADAIIAAAEKSIGIYVGVSEMCARTTREVLALAGHPAAKKNTSTADLDVPVGYAPSKVNGDLAGSFAGSDMGKV